jgi:pimeloyl-ACP methyl ester carboxylesterase
MKQAIVLIGGYNSLWPAYLKMARDLEDVAGLQAIGVPLMPWDWWRMRNEEDATNILQKLARTVTWARRKFQAEQSILVGHSAGGVIARLYLHRESIWGNTYAGVEHVTHLITLGSPHCDSRDTEIGWFLADTANDLVPGTPYAEQLRYRTIAGQHVQGREDGTYREQRAFRMYRYFAGQGAIWGDGIVPIESAGLAGANPTVLTGIAHSRKYGRTWYGGSKTIIRQWWPEGIGHAD